MAPPAVDRAKVLAYRVASQQLHRADVDLHGMAVLDLGVQDTPYGSARLALAARTSRPPDRLPDRPADDPALTLLWSTRGAPHLHHTADLPALTTALWPLNDADATGRINTATIKDGARLGLAAFVQTARAFREAVREPMPKGEVSTAVSAMVDRSLTYDCEPCKARHISGALFQQAGLAGAVRLELAGSATMLVPLPDPPPIPAFAADVPRVVTAYLRLLGPATPAEAATFIGTAPTHLRRVWPDGLAEVTIDGRRAWLPEDRLPALRDPPPARVVRLLPPGDPYLQARDRHLLIPDAGRRSAVWRPVASPGALLVNGEIAGVWRSRMAGGRAVAFTVTPFDALAATVRRAVEEEAGRVAAARGADAARMTFGE
jgi:hypothetical protein